MAFGQAAYSRITGYIAYMIDIAADKQRPMPKTGQSHGCLASGMSAADNYGVKISAHDHTALRKQNTTKHGCDPCFVSFRAGLRQKSTAFDGTLGSFQRIDLGL
jgi:hypothetical protein